MAFMLCGMLSCYEENSAVPLINLNALECGVLIVGFKDGEGCVLSMFYRTSAGFLILSLCLYGVLPRFLRSQPDMCLVLPIFKIADMDLIRAYLAIKRSFLKVFGWT